MKKFSWLSKKTSVNNTDKYGKGIFASKEIKKGETVAVFGGHIIDIKNLNKLPEEIRDWGLQISENFVLGYLDKKEFEEVVYFNHSCDPNAGFKGQLFVIALRNIDAGEQITFDYAMVLYGNEDVEKYKIECLCGAKNCRGYVTEDDWKIPELQKKYNGYFQYFLQEKINKIK